MNKSFFFPTSSQKIKTHVVESQITLLVWPCLKKQRTFNHMIIFNVSISKFYQCSIRDFCQDISMSFSVWLGKKKNAEAIKFLGNLKKYVSKNEICFFRKGKKKKSNVSLNKKVTFVFHTILKLDFKTQIIYCIIHRCLYSLFIFFFCSLILVSKKRNIEAMLTLTYS